MSENDTIQKKSKSQINKAVFFTCLLYTSPQRRHSAFTEYVRNNRLPEPVIRVKQPALARFSPDVSPLFVHFRADDDVTARLYARGYRLRPEFFK